MKQLKSIHIDSRRKKDATLQKLYPQASIVDVTSKGDPEWRVFSPFYPHGNITIPNSSGKTAMCVEGIWQGLKVFESVGVDFATLQNASMRNIKRTVRKYGIPRGHQYGLDNTELLGYIEARKKIFLPAYFQVLTKIIRPKLTELYNIASNQEVVLLDYETNCDINNPKKPLSHAFLIKACLEGTYDTLYDVNYLYEPTTPTGGQETPQQGAIDFLD